MNKISTLLLATGLLATERIHAFNPQPDPPGYGMIGIAAGQTLRFNVSNVALPVSRGFPPGPCRVELDLFDGSGNMLIPAIRTTLAAGVSTHLDLRGDDVTNSDHPRREVRPVFRFVDDTGLPPGPCVSSVELLDNQTGKTLTTVGPTNPGTIQGFNPQPEPPGFVGVVGIVAGQAARLNAVNIPNPSDPAFPPGPCRATLVLFDGQGNIVAHSSVVLNPGEATFLDVPFPDGIRDGGRMDLRGAVAVEKVDAKGFPPGPCRLTLEVFDRATAKTTTLIAQ